MAYQIIGNYYTSGSLYRRNGGYQFATAKFRQPYSDSMRRLDRINLRAQLQKVGPLVFAANSKASEQSSILAVQKLQLRIAEAANAAREEGLSASQRLNLSV